MPESQREVQALLALSQAERPKRVRHLLAHFGSAQEALAAANWTAAVGANVRPNNVRRRPISLGPPSSGNGSARPADAVCPQQTRTIHHYWAKSPRHHPCCLRWGQTTWSRPP